jgi:copper chaperone CopZ
MKKSLLLAFFAFMTLGLAAQSDNSGFVKKKAATASTVKTETFKVLGNCGMCEKTIEKAAGNAGATSAEWNRELKQITVVFDSMNTTLDAIQKAIATAGYDNAAYKASDEAYEKLHECCHYEREQ